jgi:hypothetical protein
MDWTTIITSSVGAGVISGFIAQGAPWLREVINNGRAADFSALRLALMLEDYAGQCSDLYGGVHTAISSHGHAGSLRTHLPVLPDYPADIAWHALGTKLTEKVLTLRVARADVGAEINNEAEHHSGAADDLADYVGDKAIDLGLKAVAVAEHLRKKRKLSPAYPEGRWNLKNYLVEKAAEIAAQRARYEARQAASHAEMMASIEDAGTQATG